MTWSLEKKNYLAHSYKGHLHTVPAIELADAAGYTFFAIA